MFSFVDTSTGCLTISLYSYLFSFVFNFFECEETFFSSVSFKKPYIRVKVAEGFNLRKVILHCRESGYDSADTQYEAADPDVNYRASNPSSVPSVTYEVDTKSSEGRRGNRSGAPKEQPPDYAVVSKTKKKKKVRLYMSSSKRILPFD